MRLSDYIQGLRKGKEAHRLEKESMKDPFLADAIDGYNQVEGNHEQRIEQLRIQISARSTKKRNTYAIIWSVAACLVIGFGISSYFLFLKETPEPVIPIIPQKEIALVPTKTKTDSTPISPVPRNKRKKRYHRQKPDYHFQASKCSHYNNAYGGGNFGSNGCSNRRRSNNDNRSF